MSGESLPVAVEVGHRPGAEPDDADVQAVFEALADRDCRRVLRAVADESLTANECARACDVPLSTTYRKLELLGEANLVEERLRLRRDGKHANEYRRRFEHVCVSVEDDGSFELAVSPAAGPTSSSDTS